MASHVYEGMFILDSNRYARDPGGISAQIPKLIEKCGGEMLASRLWNEQRMAYPINGQKKGTYWLTYFRIEGPRLPTLNRECQLNENILRNMVLKVDPRLADTLIDHATGVTKAEPAAEEKADDKKPEAVAEVEK